MLIGQLDELNFWKMLELSDGKGATVNQYVIVNWQQFNKYCQPYERLSQNN
jgi:hypothetical protein